MMRAVGGVLLGYLAMALAVFATFSLTYMALGADGAFRPGSYEVSALWLAVSTGLSIGAAVLGGYVCALVGRTPGPVRTLAGLVLVLGLAMAIPALTSDDPPRVRAAQVDNVEALQNARQPAFVTLLNPLIGAAGVLVGAGLRRRPADGAA